MLHRFHSKPPLNAALLAVFGICAIPVFGQQSYRSYQQLSGRVLNQVAPAEQKTSIPPASSRRFRGWNQAAKLQSEAAKASTRPRARAERADFLKSVARSAVRNTSPSAQFPPSALPGFLLRDSLPAGFIPSSVATGDFNGDGKLDFVVANAGDNNLWLYFGKGDGTFNLPIILPVTLGQTPVWVVTGDLRGVGKTDLIVAEPDSNSVGIFLGNGDGTFSESAVAIPGGAATLLVGDFNRDGKLDVVAPLDDSNSNNYIVMLPGTGNGTFGAPVITPVAGYAPSIFWAASGDVNGDGYPDLLLISSLVQEIAVQVFLNKKDGTFSAGQVIAEDFPGAGEEYLSGLLFDADGDGVVDAVVTDSLDALWVFHGNGDGTFNTTNPGMFGTGDVTFGMAIADVNGDGHADVVLSGAFVNDLQLYGAQAGDQICVLEGDGKGNFSAPKVYRGDSSSFSLAVGDFNGDGHPDAVTANQDNDTVTVFLNDGSGGYGSPKGDWVGYEGPSAANAPMSGVVMSDVDGDGSIDVAFLEWNQYPDIFHQLTVLLNDGKGNLSAPIRSDAIDSRFNTVDDFVLADFRNTGRPDFLAIAANYTSYGNYLSFAPNSGGGHFGPLSVTTPANAIGVIGVGDFNHDGKLDFVAAGFGIGNDASNNQGIQVFLGGGDGTFQNGYLQTFGGRPDRYPVAVYVGDFNRDGNLDLLVFLEANAGLTSNDAVYEFFGNGDGTFQTGKLLFTHFGPMVVADVDNDGHPDIVNMLFPSFLVASTTFLNPIQFSIYIGQPDGSFKLTNTYAPYGYGGVLAQPAYPPTQGKFTPMVADFNGDGNLDIAAFQWPGTVNKDVFAQLLLGNGDGTFTPTYDVFDFKKPFVTAYAADLMGTGWATLFELNGYRSTYNELPSVVAPAFQMAVLEDPVTGSQGSALVLLDAPSATSTTINLSASDPAITLPVNITIPAGSVSQSFNFGIGSSFNANHVFAITAQMGSTTATAYGTAAASGSAGLLVQPGGTQSWPNVNLGPGQTETKLSVVVRSVHGYTTTANLECQGLPATASCSFVPATLNVRSADLANSAMNVTVSANATQGSYPATLHVTDGVLSQDFPFTLNVGDFSLNLSPQTIQMFPTDQMGSYNASVGSVNEFDQLVNLTCGGLPTGATCNTLSFVYPPNGGTPVVVGVQTQSVPVGSYQITVTGTSQSITHTATAQLQISDFTPSVSPSSAAVKAGSSATFNVTVTPLNGFNQNVNFSCGTSSNLVSCSFSPSSMTVPGTGTAVSVLTLTTSPQAAASKRSGLQTLFLGPPLAGFAFSMFLLRAKRSRRRWMASAGVLLLLCGIPSCGGGGGSTYNSGGGGSTGGGGGGGGGNSRNYSITVQVSSGTNVTKTAGTITLTVN